MAPATEPCAVVPVRSWFARVLALAAVEPFAVALPADVPLAVVLPVAPVLVPVVLRDAEVAERPLVVARPDVAGVHGAAFVPVCTPCDDDVLPVDWAIAGTASARLSATPPAHVIHFLLT